MCYQPWFTSMSVSVCHLFVATYQLLLPRRRQLRSITSLLLSPSRAASTASSRSWLKRASGKRYEVMIICTSQSLCPSLMLAFKEQVPFPRRHQSKIWRSCH